jgi:hypothetical protein
VVVNAGHYLRCVGQAMRRRDHHLAAKFPVAVAVAEVEVHAVRGARGTANTSSFTGCHLGKAGEVLPDFLRALRS